MRFFASRLESGGKTVALVLDAMVWGVFALFGFFAGKGHSWSFIVGMIFYAMDGLLILGLSLKAGVNLPILSLGFHAYVLFILFTGLKACMDLKAAARGAGH